MTLFEVAQELSRRLTSTFLRDADGRRPVYGGTATFQNDPHWRDLILFYEYFHGDNGAGLGASHQTGWTGLAAPLLDLFARLEPEDLEAERGQLEDRLVREQVGGKPKRSHSEQVSRPSSRSTRGSGSRSSRPRWGERRRSTTSPTSSSTGSPPTGSTSSGSSASGRPATPPGASRGRTPSGWRSTATSCPTSVRTTSAVRASRYGTTGSTRTSAATRRWPGSASASERRGLRLVLDFVPNHMAPDHDWVIEHPDFFVAGTEEQLAASPQNYCRVETGDGLRVLAYGRDPYFDGWPDTLQLNYGNPALQEAMLGELERIAGQCDGVRCDMAMLVLPEVFERTWGIAAPAVLAARHRRRPSRGPRVSSSSPRSTGTSNGRCSSRASTTPTTSGSTTAWWKATLRPFASTSRAGLDFQDRLARFLENHDEPRAAATFAPDVHRAAAVITFLTPGLRFVHQGQREGKRRAHPGPSRSRADRGRRCRRSPPSTTACSTA